MKRTPKESESKPQSHRFRFIASLLLTAIFAALYIVRPDAMQMIHWWPLVIWTPVVFLPFILFFWRFRKAPLWAALAWLACLLCLDGGAWRWVLPPAEKAGLRIVSLNIEGGDFEAMAEALATKADLIFLQEVAGKDEVIAAGRKAGYPYVVIGLDTAILAKAELTSPVLDRDFVSAGTTLQGKSIRVTSLRLAPPVFRLDFHSLAAWREYADDIVRRRARFREIMTASPAQIIGGDFNCTNPTLTNGYQLSESFNDAGRGWPGTGTNEFPFVRVDQIWGDKSIDFSQSFVRKTLHSDHRMVIADFKVQ